MIARFRERDPLILIWSGLTRRSLSAAERELFMERNEARRLRALLATHGGQWMWAMGERCVRQGKDGRGLLRLADWLRECLGPPPEGSEISDTGGHPARKRLMSAADLPSIQNYDDNT